MEPTHTPPTTTSAFGYYQLVLKRYTQFSGRARRAEYWWFVLFNALISWAFTLVGTFALHSPWFGNIYTFAVLIPSIAVGVRRMHDVGKSGWFLLIPLYNLILAVTEGNRGPNEYGPDPKGADTADLLDTNPEVY